MRFERIRMRGLGPFAKEIDLNLAALSGSVIAVTGANGSGKSSLLEMLTGGALFRQTATRGTLADLATARDAFLEVQCVNGKSITIRHQIDNISGKGESLVTDVDGKPLLSSTSVRAFDTYAKEHLPSEEVLYASTVSPQASGGMLEMTDGARRSVLLRALNVHRYEPIAKRAGERLAIAKKALDVLVARLADEAARAYPGGVAGAEDTLAKTHEDARVAGLMVTQAQAALTSVRAAAAEAETANRTIDERRARVAEARAKAVAIDTRIADLEARLANNRGVLAEAEAIRSAAARLIEVDAALTAGRAEDAQHARDAATATADATRFDAELRNIGVRRSTETGREARARALLADRTDVESAALGVADMKLDVDNVTQLVETAERELSELQAQRLEGATDRIDALRGALTEIKGATNVASAHALAASSLLNDDGAVTKAAEHPHAVAAASARVQTQRAALRQARERLARAESMAARLPAIENAAAELTAAEAAITAARDEELAAASNANGARARRDVALRAQSDLRQRFDALSTERANVAPIAAKADRLAAAEARIAEINPQIDAARAERVALAPELPAEEVAAVPIPDTRPAERDVAEAERARSVAERAEGVAAKDLETAHEALARVAQIETQRVAAADEIADFTLLADAFGAKGIPALVVDASAGEITAIANELLHEAFGPRFTVQLTTTRLADAGHEIETCSLQVLDTQNGREGDAETLSGGEKVIVGEALSLALATVGCRRNGVEGPTIVRDESGAALDGRNAQRYVTMLRRAGRMIGASRILIVSHSPDVWPLCDGSIHVVDGRVEVLAS